MGGNLSLPGLNTSLDSDPNAMLGQTPEQDKVAINVKPLGITVRFPASMPMEEIDANLRARYPQLEEQVRTRMGVSPEQFQQAQGLAFGQQKLPLAPEPDYNLASRVASTEPFKALDRGIRQTAANIGGAGVEAAGGALATLSKGMRDFGLEQPLGADIQNPFEGQSQVARQTFGVDDPRIQPSQRMQDTTYTGAATEVLTGQGGAGGRVAAAKDFSTKLISDTLGIAPSMAATVAGFLIAGPAGAGAMGGFLEGASQYEAAKTAGKSEAKALQELTTVGVGTGVLNSIPFLKAFDKVLPDKWKGLASNALMRGFAEGATETAEGALPPLAGLDRIPKTTKEATDLLVEMGAGIYDESGVFLPAMISGGMMGGGATAPSRAQQPPVAQPVGEEPLQIEYQRKLGLDDPSRYPAIPIEPTSGPAIPLGRPQQPGVAYAPDVAPELGIAGLGNAEPGQRNQRDYGDTSGAGPYFTPNIPGALTDTPIVEQPRQAPKGLRRYEPIFEQAAQSTDGVVSKDLLMAVAMVESGGNPKAVSPKGAKGLMQIMPGTAKDLGITDAGDPKQAIPGAAQYLAQGLARHNGDLDLALADYNAGPGNVDKYQGVPPFKETQEYIRKVRAAMASIQGDNTTATLLRTPPEKLQEVADARVSKGKPITAKEVREILGEGDKESVKPIRDWVNEQVEALPPVEEVAPLPELPAAAAPVAQPAPQPQQEGGESYGMRQEAQGRQGEVTPAQQAGGVQVPPSAKQPWEMTKDEFQLKSTTVGKDDSIYVYHVSGSEKHGGQAGQGQRYVTTDLNFAETFVAPDSQLEVIRVPRNALKPSPEGLRRGANLYQEALVNESDILERYAAPVSSKTFEEARSKVKRPHNLFIESALASGKPVPAEVLADYPDLAAKYQQPPARTQTLQTAAQNKVYGAGGKWIAPDESMPTVQRNPYIDEQWGKFSDTVERSRFKFATKYGYGPKDRTLLITPNEQLVSAFRKGKNSGEGKVINLDGDEYFVKWDDRAKTYQIYPGKSEGMSVPIATTLGSDLVAPPKAQVVESSSTLDARQQVLSTAAQNKPIKLKVYRGEMGNITESGKHLQGMQTIDEVIDGKRKDEVDLAPLEFYTENPSDAERYANAEQEMIKALRAKGSPDPEESFRVLWGREPRGRGVVNEMEVEVNNPLDLRPLGSVVDYNDAVEFLAKVEGIPIPQKGKNRATDPEWLALDRLMERLGIDDLAGEAEQFLAYMLMRNGPKESWRKNKGTDFVDWVKSKGYDSIRYTEGDSDHIAVIQQPKTSTPPARTQTLQTAAQNLAAIEGKAEPVVSEGQAKAFDRLVGDDWSPPKDKDKRSELLQLMRDNVKTRRAKNQQVPEETLRRIALIEAMDSGVETSTGEIVSLQVYGHPMVTASDGSGVENLIPIKIAASTDLGWRFEKAQSMVDALQSKIGEARAIAEGKLKASPAKKKEAKSYLSSTTYDEDAARLDSLRTETLTELTRLSKEQAKAVPPPSPAPPFEPQSTPQPSEQPPLTFRRVKVGKKNAYDTTVAGRNVTIDRTAAEPGLPFEVRVEGQSGPVDFFRTLGEAKEYVSNTLRQEMEADAQGDVVAEAPVAPTPAIKESLTTAPQPSGETGQLAESRGGPVSVGTKFGNETTGEWEVTRQRADGSFEVKVPDAPTKYGTNEPDPNYREIYSADEVEKLIAAVPERTRVLTENQQFQAAAAEKQSIQDAADAKRKAADEDVDGFDESLSPMAKKKVQSILNKVVSDLDGKPMTRKQRIRNAVAAGTEVKKSQDGSDLIYFRGGKIPTTTGGFVPGDGFMYVTKTEADYAKYLLSKRDSEGADVPESNFGNIGKATGDNTLQTTSPRPIWKMPFKQYAKERMASENLTDPREIAEREQALRQTHRKAVLEAQAKGEKVPVANVKEYGGGVAEAPAAPAKVSPSAPAQAYSMTYTAPDGNRVAVHFSKARFNDLPEEIQQDVRDALSRANSYGYSKEAKELNDFIEGKTLRYLQRSERNNEAPQHTIYDTEGEFRDAFARFATDTSGRFHDRLLSDRSKRLAAEIIAERDAAQNESQAKAQAEQQKRLSKERRFQEIVSEIDAIQMPKGERISFRPAGTFEDVSGTKYGAWVLHKSPVKGKTKLSHYQSGLGLSALSTSEAKRFIKGTLKANSDVDFIDNASGKEKVEALGEIYNFLFRGGDIPASLTTKPAPAKPAPAAGKQTTQPTPQQNLSALRDKAQAEGLSMMEQKQGTDRAKAAFMELYPGSSGKAFMDFMRTGNPPKKPKSDAKASADDRLRTKAGAHSSYQAHMAIGRINELTDKEISGRSSQARKKAIEKEYQSLRLHAGKLGVTEFPYIGRFYDPQQYKDAASELLKALPDWGETYAAHQKPKRGADPTNPEAGVISTETPRAVWNALYDLGFKTFVSPGGTQAEAEAFDKARVASMGITNRAALQRKRLANQQAQQLRRAFRNRSEQRLVRDAIDGLKDGAFTMAQAKDNMTPQEMMQSVKDVLNGKASKFYVPKGLFDSTKAQRDLLDAASRQILENGIATSQGQVEAVKRGIGLWLRRSYEVHDNSNWVQQVIGTKEWRTAVSEMEKEWQEATQSPESLTDIELIQFGRRHLPDVKNSKEIDKIIQTMEAAENPEVLDPKARKDIEDALRALPPRTKAQFENRLKTMLANMAQEGREGFLNRRLGSQDRSSLMRRKTIPKWLRDVMGEYRDPEINFARSAEIQAQMIAAWEFAASFYNAGKGKFVFDSVDDLPANDKTEYVTMPDNPKYGMLAGKLVSKDIKAMLDENKNNPDSFLKFVSTISGGVRWMKTVGNVYTGGGVRNFMGGGMAALGRGDIPVSTLYKVFKDLNSGKTIEQTVARSLGINASDPEGIMKALRDHHEKMVELGVHDTDPNFNLVRERLKDSFFGKKDFDPNNPHIFSKVNSNMADLWLLGDNVWKSISYIENKNRYEKQADRLGWNERERERNAADIVRGISPTYDAAFPIVNKLKNSSANVVWQDFITWPAERVRNKINLGKLIYHELNSGAPELVASGMYRLGSAISYHYALTAALGALGLWQLGGDDPDEDWAVRELLPHWMRFAPLHHLGKNEDGSYSVIDLGFTDADSLFNKGLLAMLEGKPKDAALEWLNTFFGTSIAFDTAIELYFNHKATGSPVYLEHDEWHEKLAKAVKYATMKSGPPVAGIAWQLYDRANGKAIETETRPLADRISSLIGLSFWTMQPSEAFNFKANAAASHFRDISQSITTRKKQYPQENLKDIQKAYEERRNKYAAELVEYGVAARVAGVTPQGLRKQMKDAAVREDYINAIMSGINKSYKTLKDTGVKDFSDVSLPTGAKASGGGNFGGSVGGTVGGSFGGSVGGEIR